MTSRTLTHALAMALAAGCLAGCGWLRSARGPSMAEVGPKPPPVQPPKPEAIEAAVTRGVDFLLRDQNPDGSWGGARRTKGLNIYAPVPGAHHAFRAAVTGLCIAALIESGDARPEAQAALERAEAWMLRFLPRLRRATPRAIYNVWGHAYAIQALVRMHERAETDTRRSKIVELIRDQVGFLERYESVDGGWGYYDFRAHTDKPSSRPNSFTTATPLIALKEAEAIGIE
ncbi:MAG: hypothetical protein ACODAJ_09985, partial [Planctomycetota bacterium]